MTWIHLRDDRRVHGSYHAPLPGGRYATVVPGEHEAPSPSAQRTNIRFLTLDT